MFMSNPGKGGRGKLAPYKTIHYRIPEPIKSTVERLAAAYRTLAGTRSWDECSKLLGKVESVICNDDNDEKRQLTAYDEIVENLQNELAISKEKIEQLESEKRKALEILVPSLECKPQQARIVQEAIRTAFPELAQLPKKK